MAVFVLDKKKHPLMPCSEKRARLLLARGRAVVVRLAPFTIRLKDRIGGATQPLRLKLDPGSKSTGVAMVREAETVDHETGEIVRTATVLWLGEIAHRGQQIGDALTARSQMRRRRRTANLRHRAARFNNRTKPKGWLAPSLRHRIETTTAWVERLPYAGITFEKSFSRMDDGRREDLRRYLPPSQSSEPEPSRREVADQMRMTTELVAPGTQLYTEIDILDASQIELGALVSALYRWADSPYLGGQANKGHGKVSLEYTMSEPGQSGSERVFFSVSSDGLRCISGPAQSALDAYGAHLLALYNDMLEAQSPDLRSLVGAV